MRSSGWLFALIAFFFGLIAAVYWYLSEEPAGTAALVFTGAFGFLIAFYLLFTAKRVEPLPEDDDEGDIAEGAGVQGFYSPHSWWPLVIGGGAAVIAIGVIFLMWWLIILGFVVTVIGVTGTLFEYYAGAFVRE
ncbi:MAG TPA: cytochrome c oxidase subunit 4 [Actinomycetes bacterium]|nr:cytochrome c oxidase subunit 4 [Actinomycetes bacterium]